MDAPDELLVSNRLLVRLSVLGRSFLPCLDLLLPSLVLGTLLVLLLRGFGRLSFVLVWLLGGGLLVSTALC
jgi:hypothetical protein